MYKENILIKLEELLSAYTRVSPISYDSDIMGEPILLSERDAASFFLDVEEEYKIDLNQLISDLIVYSISAIADRLLVLYSKDNVCCV
jgi:hypothetical protein